MSNMDWFKAKNPKPVCSGTGLVALDVVINGNTTTPPRLWAGGSCGNVLIILSYLGWNSYPIAKLMNDDAAAELIRDLVKWNVKTKLILLDQSGSTPVIVERIGKSRNGNPKHRFEWNCPNCGAFLPKYRPVLARESEGIIKKMPKSQVFYFDRVARSSISLAQENKNRGALIVFEPSGVKDEKLFSECLQVADVVKYSHERFGHFQDLIFEVGALLEIETFGEDGLRYRIKRNGRKVSSWKSKAAYVVEGLKDSAGAGDWCTAGIIHHLGFAGKEGFLEASEKDIDDAINFGQALAALSCRYEGARGNMYCLSRQEFREFVHGVLSQEESSKASEDIKQGPIHNSFYCVSPECRKSVKTYASGA